MKNQILASDSKQMQQLFARAGMPHSVTVSDRLRQAYQMPDDLAEPEWVELAWIVNLIINQCVPATELDNSHGHVRIAEFSSIPVGRGDSGERNIAVAQPDAFTLHVALPDEVSDSTKQVLLVDDDAQLREVISQLLRETGIPHECAASASEAWEKLQTSVPAVVVTDVEMPGMSGLDLCRRIKADSRTNLIPVLVMSGKPDYAAGAKEAGATGFISKPMDFQSFATRLKPFLI